jgi:glycosyltransferase involved in cell wall biosynthesis
VIITGPLWLHQYVPKAKHFEERLDIKTVDKFIKYFGHADYLFAGHEYFDKDDYIQTFKKVAKKNFTYILHPYTFKKNFFDKKRIFMFCYSDQIKEIYKDFKPIKQVLFHSGVNEYPYLTNKPKKYLVWMGRIEQHKLPHLAILAAIKLNIPIYLLGKPVYESRYASKYKDILNHKIVKKMGVVFGQEKMKLISEASCAIYTVDKNFIDAGPGVLGEYLCSGVPIAGICWTKKEAVTEAVNSPYSGKIIKVNDKMDDQLIADKISKAINYCFSLDRKKIFKTANEKYNMKKIMRKIFYILDKNKSN